jgi:hypothetical protein
MNERRRTEDMMRRQITRFDRDQRVVKCSLVAATIALSVGFYAQNTLSEKAQTATTVAEKTVELKAAEDDRPAVVEVVDKNRPARPSSISG